jgi:hypothetical protein
LGFEQIAGEQGNMDAVITVFVEAALITYHTNHIVAIFQ